MKKTMILTSMALMSLVAVGCANEEVKDTQDNQLVVSTNMEEVQTEGNVNTVPLYIRKIITLAATYNAAEAIIAHNHPSGVPKPSDGDFTLTRQIAWDGEILGIRLMDHVIIGEDTFYSMKKENPGVSLIDIGLDQEEMDV